MNFDGDISVADISDLANTILGNNAVEELPVYTKNQVDSLMMRYMDYIKDLYNYVNKLEYKIVDMEKKIDGLSKNNELSNNDHEYVDLGLSVKWATMNVGATEVAGSKTNSHTGQLDCYGEYYAWGETTPKDSYDWSNLKYCSGTTYEGPFTKYVASSNYGTVDNKTTLELSDDAARVNWGGTWRMPTTTEQQELLNNCYWEWTTSYNGSGVTGYIVYKVKDASDKGKMKYDGSSTTTSASYSLSDTHIFLPASGYRCGSSFDYVGSCGRYWSSSLYTSDSSRAYFLYFFYYGVYWSYYDRCLGHSVRPVCP